MIRAPFGHNKTRLLLLVAAILVLFQADTYSQFRRRQQSAKPVLMLHDANYPQLSADNRRILAGSEVGVLEVYDFSTGLKLRTLQIPYSANGDHAISPDGKAITAFGDVHVSLPNNSYESIRELWVYDVESGEALKHINIDDLKALLSFSINPVNFSSDARFMANPNLSDSGSDPYQRVALVDLESQTIVRQFGKDNEGWDPWNEVALTSDARVLAATHNNINHLELEETVVWDVTSGRELLRLPFACWWLELSADGRRLVTTRNGQAHQTSVVALSVDLRGKLRTEVKTKSTSSAKQEDDTPTEIWDIATGKRISIIGSQYGNKQRPVMIRGALSPDGKLLATRSGAYLLLWDADTGRLVAAQPISEDKGDIVQTVNFSRDGLYIIASSYDELTIVWRTADVLRDAAARERDVKRLR